MAPSSGGRSPEWQYNEAGDWNGGGLHISDSDWAENFLGFGTLDTAAALRLAESWHLVDLESYTYYASYDPNVIYSQSRDTQIASYSSQPINLDLDSGGYRSSFTSSATTPLEGNLVTMRVETVEIQVNLSSNRVSDVTIDLLSVEGTQVRIFDGQEAANTGATVYDPNWVFTSTAFWGETTGGALGNGWRLIVTDNVSGETTHLTDWTITLYGSELYQETYFQGPYTGNVVSWIAQPINNVYYYTDEFANFIGDTSRQFLGDGLGHDVLNAAAVSSDMYINLATGTAVIAGNTLTINQVGIYDVIGGAGNDTIIGNGLINLLYGGDGDDTLDGGIGGGQLIGGTGNDTYYLHGLTVGFVEEVDGGFDTVYTGRMDYQAFVWENIEQVLFDPDSWDVIGTSGNDTIISGNRDNNIRGMDGDDIIYGMEGRDTIYGNNGNDMIYGGDHDDLLSGGNGNDTLFGDSGNDILYGNSGNDILYGGDGDDYLNGASWMAYYADGPGSLNILNGGRGNDTIFGGNGDDKYIFEDNWGKDKVYDSLGINSFSFNTISNLVIDLGALIATDGINSITWGFLGNVIQNVDAGSGNDNVTGNTLNNTMNGHDGNDILSGMSGNDILSGGEGNDLLQGGADNDSYIDFIGNFGTDIIDDISGTDTLNLNNYNSDAVLSWIAMDTNFDTLVDSLFMDFGSGNSITIKNYFNNISANDDASGSGAGYIENIVFSNGNLNLAAVKALATGSATAVGSATNDHMAGTAASDNIMGMDGNDRLYGRGGNDTLMGGDGNDILNGCTGDNMMVGGLGNDLYIVNSTNDTILENAGEGEDYVEAWVSYTLSENIERLQLKGAADLNGTGNSGGNYLKGNVGNNTLDGSDGNDMLMGMSGNDTLIGGNGNDYLDGGSGDDLLQGGAGDDIYFRFTGAFGNDVINDASGRDLLNLKNYSTADVLSWQALDTNADTFMDSLRMDFGGGNTITIENYFDNLNTGAALSEAGSGHMEGILFSDASLGLEDVQTLMV